MNQVVIEFVDERTYIQVPDLNKYNIKELISPSDSKIIE